MSDVVRVGVVGGGLVAQAVHLPRLTQMAERFAVVGLADPSRRVREALAARYAPVRPYADWRELLDGEELDALVVCTPPPAHAEAILAALDGGLHVFVEKPLCITVEDGRAIAERAAAAGRVVQVGYMKRFSRAYEAFLAALPEAPDGLRLIDVLTYDPWMSREPFVPWSTIVVAGDMPSELIEAAAVEEQRQVATAVGADDPESVRGFSYTFLSCLVHDVNLVQGALERLGLADGVRPRESAVWSGGDAASGSLALPGGAIWRTSWMLLRGLERFDERARVYFADAVHELAFPAPYHTAAPIEQRVLAATGGAERVQATSFVDDAFRAELEHFHDCVTQGVPCRTPPEQALWDLELLRALFLKRDRMTK